MSALIFDGQASSRRVQRPTEALPIVHLERDIPTRARWELAIDGWVAAPKTFSLAEVQSMSALERNWDLHCVWGWSRRGCRWEGIPAGTLIDAAGPLARGAHAVVSAVESSIGSGRPVYASCLTLEEARAGLLAFRLDGSDIPPENGGPLRFIPPPWKWAYKGVKWVGSITLCEEFSPGFWEELVGDPHGDIPPGMADLEFE